MSVASLIVNIVASTVNFRTEIVTESPMKFPNRYFVDLSQIELKYSALCVYIYTKTN